MCYRKICPSNLFLRKVAQGRARSSKILLRKVCARSRARPAQGPRARSHKAAQGPVRVPAQGPAQDPAMARARVSRKVAQDLRARSRRKVFL